MPLLQPLVFPASAKVAATPAAGATLKEDDFPSLSSRAISTPMTPAYSAQSRKTSSFQDEDFPALVSKVRPPKAAVRSNSAWANHTPAAKSITPAPPPAKLPPAPFSGPQPLSSTPSSSSSSSSRRKKKVGDSGRVACARSPPLSDDEGGGLTQQEFRSVPTMLDISSLLTVKGGGSSSKPSKATTAPAATPPIQPTALEPPAPKAGKRKKQKNAEKSAASTPSVGSQGAASMETAAQKENVPDKTWNKVAPAAPPCGLVNGHTEKPPANKKEADHVTSRQTKDSPLPEQQQQEEEFPALMTKKPPPGRDGCCDDDDQCV